MNQNTHSKINAHASVLGLVSQQIHSINLLRKTPFEHFFPLDSSDMHQKHSDYKIARKRILSSFWEYNKSEQNQEEYAICSKILLNSIFSKYNYLDVALADFTINNQSMMAKYTTDGMLNNTKDRILSHSNLFQKFISEITSCANEIVLDINERLRAQYGKTYEYRALKEYLLHTVHLFRNSTDFFFSAMQNEYNKVLQTRPIRVHYPQETVYLAAQTNACILFSLPAQEDKKSPILFPEPKKRRRRTGA